MIWCLEDVYKIIENRAQLNGSIKDVKEAIFYHSALNSSGNQHVFGLQKNMVFIGSMKLVISPNNGNSEALFSFVQARVNADDENVPYYASKKIGLEDNFIDDVQGIILNHITYELSTASAGLQFHRICTMFSGFVVTMSKEVDHSTPLDTFIDVGSSNEY